MWSGALATAGDVVFYGTMDGWFKAVDAQTGNVLWQFKTGSGIIGQPITYRGPDGKQYVAVLSGVGGWAGAIVAGELDPRDATRGARLRERDERPAAAHDEGRDAVCLRAAMSAAAARRSPAVAAGCSRRLRRPARARPGAATAARLRRPEQPAVLERPARGLREPDRRAGRARAACATVDYTWWAQRRGFVRNTLKAGRVRRGHRRAGQLRAGADDAAVLPLDLRLRVARAIARRRSRRSTIRRCGACRSACS